MLRSKKRSGLENVVGAVLLLALVGALIPIVYMYLSSVVSSSVSAATKYSAIKSFIITAVNYSSSTDTLAIYVLNTGEVPINITDVKVLRVAAPSITELVSCTPITQLPVTVTPEHSVEIDLKCVLIKSNSYQVIVYSWSGFEASYTFYYGG
ncbi:MAG: hypothetical protein GXO26_03585 [Crenarchaeota archaeon]|nr:hypothetical protein [Thermoproteota archaeon]